MGVEGFSVDLFEVRLLLLDQVCIKKSSHQIHTIILWEMVPYHEGDKRFSLGLFEVRHPQFSPNVGKS